MKTNSVKLMWEEGNKLFDSCREADKYFDLPVGSSWRLSHRVEVMHKNAQGVTLNIVEDTLDDVSYDQSILRWIFKTEMKIRDLDSGRVFDSMRDVDRYFGLPASTTSRILRGQISSRYRGIHVEKIEVVHSIPSADDEEIFKQVPEYSEYSISNFGRVRQDRTGHIKHPTGDLVKGYFVVLNKNSKPVSASLRSLYNSAWEGISMQTRPKATGRSKKVTCISDNKEFSSYLNCVEYYHFDYQRFREALHSSDSKVFSYRGLVFERL